MLAIKGNKTTTGGEVLEGDEDFSDENGTLAKDGGLASCGRCGHNGPMLGTAKGWGLTGSTAAVNDNDIVACQCPRGTNRVIARSEYYNE